MKRLALDRGYETGAVHRGLELLGITGYIPAIQFSNPPEKYGFSYDPQLDTFIRPEGVPLTYYRLNCNKSTGKYLRCYQVEGDAYTHCSKRSNCFDKAGVRRRVLASSCYPAFYRGHQRVGTPEFLSMMRLRKIWAEGSFSVLKREHCISKIRKRGILAASEECLLAAMALNLKRMVNAIFFYLQFQCSAGTTVGFGEFLLLSTGPTLDSTVACVTAALDEQGLECAGAWVRDVLTHMPVMVLLDVNFLDPVYVPAAAKPYSGGFSVEETEDFLEICLREPDVRAVAAYGWLDHPDPGELSLMNVSAVLSALFRLVSSGKREKTIR